MAIPIDFIILSSQFSQVTQGDHHTGSFGGYGTQNGHSGYEAFTGHEFRPNHEPTLISHEEHVTKPVKVPIYKQVTVPIPYSVPVPVPKPVVIPVAQPYTVQILVPHAVPIPVIKTINVPIVKEIPEPVEKEVPYHYEKYVPVRVDVPKPYPVHVPVYKHIYLDSKSGGHSKYEVVKKTVH
ncbi:hypothetical protein CBL_02536 [Carabus blaptoides fortunei]